MKSKEGLSRYSACVLSYAFYYLGHAIYSFVKWVTGLDVVACKLEASQ